MTTARSAISPGLSAALDAARAGAAIYVVLHHLAATHQLTTGVGIALRFGQEAVLLFFLLSGFVIFANEHQRATSLRGYYWRRIRRICPALIAAMLVSSLVAWGDGTFATLFDARQLLATIACVQDLSAFKPGVVADPYMRNDPLWSLSYEVFFYALFPWVLRCWHRHPSRCDHLIGLSCCLTYAAYVYAPGHLALVTAYFQVWWAGAMAAHAYLQGARDIRGLLRAYAWLLALCAVAAAAVVIEGFDGLGTYPFLPLRHFLAAAILLAVLGGPLGRLLCRWLAHVRAPATAVASISLAIYVLHFPLLVQWSLARTLPGFCIALATLLAASYLVDRTLPRLLPRAPSA